MIRVAHLLPSMAVGGRERIVADLCRSSAEHGIAPLVITFDRADGVALDPHAPIVALDRSDRDFAKQMRSTIDARRIDVVHAQGHVSAALLPELDVPVVTTLHVALGKGWRWLPAIASGLRRSCAITAVSDDLARRFRWIRRPIEVIPPGIDLARFCGTQRATERPFTLGIAARLHPVKRHCDLLAALHLLQRRDRHCRLLIAGEGPAAARIRARSTGLDVTMLGAVADIPGYLRRLDAFVLPSDHEGTPVALIEAMASGLPVIASAVGGVPALVGAAGLLVPRRNPSRLADSIERLMDSTDLQRALGRAAQTRIGSYRSDAQARAYRTLYDVVAKT
ncbi:glycosyltransferase [Sphingomonas sp. 2R-10]|uniref:glycosyltransferase n=1 Tax=Sphingomonas sp. 2R-10 TaxID=3045148 RepID=UPI000F78D34E|nr:glycosyltransferase [Sphingomonas sp. 2R-10]MDJ0278663.1 glycosyltransferase [Sphingomonas sp. 2R-10]